MRKSDAGSLGDVGATDVVETSPEIPSANGSAACEPGRYVRYNRALGQGAYKTVWKAYDNEDGTEVAWNKVQSGSVKSMAEKERQRILDEIRILERVEHPRVLQFHHAWVAVDQMSYNFITEMMTSGTLKGEKYHIKRPLAPPYSLHTVLLKVGSYNDVFLRHAERVRPDPQDEQPPHRQEVVPPDPRGAAGEVII